MNASASSTQKSMLLLFACVAIVIVASLAAGLLQSDGGRVAVQSIKFPTQNGQWVAADLFKPCSATEQTPAPLVVIVPGFQRSKEALSNISLELSRRGVVVIAIDPYAQGDSSSSLRLQSATTEGYGMFAVVDYAYDTPILNYVDKSRIGATGHSAGGNAALRGAQHFGNLAKRTGKPSKLQSVYISGYVLSISKNVVKNVQSNIGMSYALYDEGAYRNQRESGDMRKSPEALLLVNSGRSSEESHVEEVQIGRYYGNQDDRTLRVVHNERLIHPFQPYDIGAIANLIEFFDRAFGLKSGLSPHDQIWYWKELLTLISAVAAMVAIVPFGRLMLSVPFFQSLVHPIPAAPLATQGNGRWVFWSVFAFSALFACFTYIPMANVSQHLFVDATNRVATWFFPQRMNNALMLWALLNGVVGFAVFFLVYHYSGKRHGTRSEMWGATMKPAELIKTFLLATTIATFFFGLLFFLYYLFHVDYRFIFFGARVFSPVTIVLLCMYGPIFFVFFLSNSLRVNGAMRFEGQAEWKSMLLAGIANSLGLMLIQLIQYSVFALTGTVYWTDGWLYVNLLFAVVPIMFVLPYFHRYFFRMTGRIYLGPITMCMIFITILLSGTVCYIPL
jgi:hypothetical protein